MEEAGRSRFLLNLPPGYHFEPTDAELILHYLRRKMAGLPPHLPIFKDVTPIVGHRPEDLIAKFRDHGEDRWYFFTKRNRKYSSGNRPDRTTPGKGFWKATGPQRRIRVAGELVGRVRLLVFYTGQEEEKAAAPTEKTYWTMHEYENLTSEEEDQDKNIDKLHEWVLCTIQKQKNPRFNDKKEEGSCAGAGDKVKKRKAKGEGKAGGKKRKGKAEKEVDIWRSEVPEKGDEMDMFDFEQPSCNKKRPQMQQLDEPPRSEATMIVDGYDYGPHMAPLQEPPPHSDTMDLPHYGGSYNMCSTDIRSLMLQLSQAEMVSRPGTPYRLDGYMPPQQEYEMAPVLGIGYNNYNMTYQPDTSYQHDVAPLETFGYGHNYGYNYGGAAHQLAGHWNNFGYAAGGHPVSPLATGNISYAFPQQSYAAAGTNKLGLVKGAMSSQQVGL